MIFCDTNESIVKWNSEGVKIPYVSPLDKKMHNYYVDFYIELKKDKSIEKWLIEIKPKKHWLYKPKKPKKSTFRSLENYGNAVRRYIINREKIKVAKIFASKTGMNFGMVTENFIFSNGL